MVRKPKAHKPLPVAGYKPQSPEDVALANEGKHIEERVLRYIDKLRKIDAIDPRLLAVGHTDIQKGFMMVIRSIFQPKRIEGDLQL